MLPRTLLCGRRGTLDLSAAGMSPMISSGEVPTPYCDSSNAITKSRGTCSLLKRVRCCPAVCCATTGEAPDDTPVTMARSKAMRLTEHGVMVPPIGARSSSRETLVGLDNTAAHLNPSILRSIIRHRRASGGTETANVTNRTEPLGDCLDQLCV